MKKKLKIEIDDAFSEQNPDEIIYDEEIENLNTNNDQMNWEGNLEISEKNIEVNAKDNHEFIEMTT